MGKVKDFIFGSNRMWHLGCGVCVGLGADDWYCAEYTGVGVASALEFKDWQWGGKPDIWDWLFTVAGVNIGYSIRYFLL